MIPYAEITEKADRRWTARLVERLAGPELPEAELDALVGALQAVSDPRSFAPLEAILCDAGLPDGNRRGAGAALRGLDHTAIDIPAERLRRWWRDGDAVLRREALRFMSGIACPEIVLAVASDAAHPWQAEALGGMAFWFGRAEHQAVKIAGLSHPDREVRLAAAEVLLWEEPVAAEGALIAAANGPDAEVAREAANTLRYYPSRRVLRCLRGLLDHPDKSVRDQAAESFTEVRDEFERVLHRASPQDAAHLRAWMAPVWEILSFTEEELWPEEGPEYRRDPPEARPVYALAEILALLADAGASPIILLERLRSADWSAYDEGERGILRPVLLGHADQFVREHAAGIFGGWQDAAALLTLLGDADFSVRKSAMYNLGELPPDRGLAVVALRHMGRGDVLGTHLNESFRAYVRHADRDEAVRRLAEWAADPAQEESLRSASVWQLERMGARAEIAALTHILAEPPAVTWSLHIAVLDALADFGLPPPLLHHLREVDNLGLQVVLAAFT